jgi:hypothetical protein
MIPIDPRQGKDDLATGRAPALIEGCKLVSPAAMLTNPLGTTKQQPA